MPADGLGCTDADYQRVDVEGAVVLVDRGQCPFGAKQTAAAAHGAVAIVVANNVDGETLDVTLGGQTEVRIPAIMVTKADGARLRTRPAPTTIRMNAGVRTVQTRNVIAQTKTGSTQDVVVVGGHLDSVPAGPGINDDGSGVAAVLETALQMGSSPPVRNAVRFGFWAAEEVGLLGSANYVQSLNVDQLMNIAMYLNFDMLGSPNPAYFTMDGDQSAPPVPERMPPRIPEGSAGIERALVDYLASAGKTAQDSAFVGSSDYDSFTRAGIRRRHLLGCRCRYDRRPGRNLGRRGRPALRSQIPPQHRHPGSDRPNGVGYQRPRSCLRCRALFTGSRRPQWSARALRPHPVPKS